MSVPVEPPVIKPARFTVDQSNIQISTLPLPTFFSPTSGKMKAQQPGGPLRGAKLPRSPSWGFALWFFDVDLPN
jgi:hypothetical protein